MKNIFHSIFLITVLFIGKSASAQTTGVGFNTTSPQALIHMEDGHMKSTQTGGITNSANINGLTITDPNPTIQPSLPFFPFTGAGNPDNLQEPLSLPTDVRGTFALKGSSNGGTTACIIKFKTPYNARPTVLISPAANTMSAVTDQNWNWYTVATLNGFTFYFFTKNNTSAVNFYFNYLIIE